MGRRDPKRAWSGYVLPRLAAPVALALVAVGVTSCSGAHSVTGTVVVHHAVDPSVGCRNRLLPSAVPAGDQRTEALAEGGTSGTYTLSVPRSYRAGHPIAVILLFYGFGSNPAQFSSLTGLPSVGSRRGYLVVVPHTQGSETEWRLNAHGSDAGFVDALVESVERAYCVDRHAVFTVGFSAGAAFAILYSCAHQGQIAGIATVAVEFQLGCSRPESILAFHGTKDPLVPYQNGAIGLSVPGVKVRGTQRNMADWARLDRCRTVPRRARIGSQVIRQQWYGCARGTSAVLYTIVGGGHSWPGADPTQAVGLTTHQVDASSQVLSFFDRIRD